MTNIVQGGGAPPAELDLTSEADISTTTAPSAGAATSVPSLQKNRWDDAARVGLAFILVGLLAFVVISTTLVVVTGKSSQEVTIESYLKVVLSPIIGIVGSVVGFYFGAKSQSG